MKCDWLQLCVGVSALLMCIALSVNAQYEHPYEPQQRAPQYEQPQRPLPVILMHKQSLAQDGSFNYAFAADNGLQQGESISPDGTRRGSYSYVDPNGKKISVKYTAGKEGFRILEGDHLPKAPTPVAAAPAGGFAPRQSHYQAAPSYTAGYQGAGSNVLFRGQEGSPYYKVQDDYESKSAAKNVYQASAPASFPTTEQRRAHPVVPQPPAHYGGSSQPDAEGRQEPHTFGGGYAFEFSG
ncbi:Cuticle protein 6 [Zootermopsis nevadensis]|uniref:Cuticle protein 6 n=1 Tax=Zootermopsis nevadensis TaxID=136037 RepID=A0A067QIV5_ZOONE|nr:Cuticle protein 6 [Zootermopsis nevadensis]